MHVLSGERCIASGAPEEILASGEAPVRQFIQGLPDGPVPFHFPGPPIAEDLLGTAGGGAVAAAHA